MIGVDVMKIANVIVAYLDDWGRGLPRGSGCYFSCAFVRERRFRDECTLGEYGTSSK